MTSAANSVGEFNTVTASGSLVQTGYMSIESLSYGLAADVGNNHLFLAGESLFIGSPPSTITYVGEYNLTTGAAINANFITGGFPMALALDRNNHLFVAGGNNTVAEYDAVTGAVINAAFIQGLNSPVSMALDGNNHLFVVNAGNNTVGQYDATTGAAINATLIQGLQSPQEVAVDGNNHLYVVNAGNSTIGKFDASTGASINAAFIQGLDHPFGVAADALGHLFVTFDETSPTTVNFVGEYDAVTGATINPGYLNDRNFFGPPFFYEPSYLTFVAPVPEPSSFMFLVGATVAIAIGRVTYWRRGWQSNRAAATLSA